MIAPRPAVVVHQPLVCGVPGMTQPRENELLASCGDVAGHARPHTQPSPCHFVILRDVVDRAEWFFLSYRLDGFLFPAPTWESIMIIGRRQS